MEQRGPRPTALIVDDDPEIRELLRDLLELEGYPVVAAANNREALALLAALPRPCVVLLDLMMPLGGGFRLLREARSRALLHGVSVVVITALPIPQAPAGVAAVFGKPIDIPELLRVVAKSSGE
jgi:CheY-like chemotaxis protein